MNVRGNLEAAGPPAGVRPRGSKLGYSPTNGRASQSRGGHATVLGLGNSCLDTLLELDRLPPPGEFARVLRKCEQAGGQAAGAMVGCARLGLAARFLLRTGDDAAGERQRAALVKEGKGGIDLRWAKVVPGAASAHAFVLIAAGQGERIIVWRTPAELEVQAEEIEQAMFDGVAALYFDGRDSGACRKAAEMAHAAGIPVIADLDHWYPHTEALLPSIDHLIVPEEFAAAGLPAPRPGQTVVVTLGARGAEAWTRSGTKLVSPAFPVDAVDSTGAGDAFHAGYIVTLLEGRALQERLAFANATAALACTGWGAQAGLPRRAQVEALLRQAAVALD